MSKGVLTVVIPMILEHLKVSETRLAQDINDAAGDIVISQPQILRMRNGRTKEPRKASLEPIANYLGVTVNQLLNVDYMRAFLHGTPLDLEIEKIKQSVLESSFDEHEKGYIVGSIETVIKNRFQHKKSQPKGAS